MPWAEYVLWLQYFNERPNGWRDDERTAKMMAAMGVKASPENLFSTLSHMRNVEREKAVSNVPRNGSMMMQKLMGAKGGDSLDFLKDL